MAQPIFVMIMRMVIVVAERKRVLRATAAAESDGDAETMVGQLTFELRVQLYL